MDQRDSSDNLNEITDGFVPNDQSTQLPLDSLPTLDTSPSTTFDNNLWSDDIPWNNPPRQHADPQTLNAPPQMQTEDWMSSINPQLPMQESTINFSQFGETETTPSNESVPHVLASPFQCLSINPYAGPYNFTLNIPKPTKGKAKWCYSDITNKLYACKLVTFPINIKMERFPPGASLIICPIFTESSDRTLSVGRCPSCEKQDPNETSKNHVIQVEGSSPNYFFKDNRYMVSVPLPLPAPGDSSSHIFVKMGCSTICVGGPTRRPFSILVTLVLHNEEVGRQVIDSKCCAAPVRDMKNDEKDMQNPTDMESVRIIASEMGRKKRAKIVMKTPKKRTISVNDEPIDEHLHSTEYMRVPLRFQKRIKRYLNALYILEQTQKMSLHFKKLYPSETDSD